MALIETILPYEENIQLSGLPERTMRREESNAEMTDIKKDLDDFENNTNGFNEPILNTVENKEDTADEVVPIEVDVKHQKSTEALIKTGMFRKRVHPISSIVTQKVGLVDDDNESLESGQKTPEPLDEIEKDTNENRKIMRLAERMTKQTCHHDD